MNIETIIEEIDKENYKLKINDILEEHQKNKDNEMFSKISVRKQFGIYYTNFDIAYKITSETLKYNKKDFNELLFYEPCVGVGVFVITYLEYLYNKNIKQNDIINIIKNIYISDIDKDAVDIAIKLIKKFIKVKWDIFIDLKEENIFIGDVIADADCKILTIKDLFKKDLVFDLVLTNPPYKNLKATSKEFDIDKIEEYKLYYSKLSKEIRKILPNQQGTLNLYKVFLELIYTKYTEKNSCIGVIIPTTLLSDYTSTSIRKFIFENSKIDNIYLLSENTKEFKSICQAMCYFGSQRNPNIINRLTIIDEKETTIIQSMDFSEIEHIDSNATIVKLTDLTYSILNKIHKYPKIREIKDIYNLRGELDLTINKKYITNNHTKYNLLQGKNILEWNYTKNDLFTKEEFVDNEITKKVKYITEDRLICQQISNLKSKKRLKFCKIPANYVLGNSCNFIATNENISINYLLGLLNSYLFDWRFKLFSSNNHINNYELDDLPINYNEEYIAKIELYVAEILNGNFESVVDLNITVFELFNLDYNEINEIMKDYNDKNAMRIKQKLDKNIMIEIR
ncbi:Alw26I/Eco31I/Esp3I family type II restriction adenine-specific DNA-methyltransferase [Aliarcobacter butzleri]|uniref:Alw26I/Eco31I/Esp3I family type II restriction adenine-specific DNA-methyltransferase n=1 Tax=Aliarcobacter butzleri TaxID=28197 RepID=UPI001EDB749F|nr:Alw26I/Eco31I/Esp3I family type II restriction adenine-specific DNA-methyltransferase [Aliarcobacter butzleri]MCG3666105.1 Alw26I/Eco31I/Esp3I family type II restriction adenine-specific DNA-methyltransferase [Aliarcobacter butzleri]